MLRRSLLLVASIPIGVTNAHVPFSEDPRGRFNIQAAANELGLDEEYAASLFKPMHYKYGMKGQRYPAEQGKSSRPGESESVRRKIFPLYERNYRLDKKLRQLDWRRITTE